MSAMRAAIWLLSISSLASACLTGCQAAIDGGQSMDTSDVGSVPGSVTVNGQVYDVESEYLPRVIQCENPGAPTESLRAQAIAARTYLAYNTRGQAHPTIADGQSAQVFTCNANRNKSPAETPAEYQAAVADTRGQIVTYRGKGICAFFVSGAIRDAACGVALDKDGKPIDPYNTERDITINAGLSGDSVHQSRQGGNVPENRGSMGQNLSNCLAVRDGFSSAQILSFFYGNDIEITGGIGTPPPVSAPSANDPIVDPNYTPTDPLPTYTPCWSYTLQRNALAGECVETLIDGVDQWYQCDQFGNWDAPVDTVSATGPVGPCLTYFPLIH